MKISGILPLRNGVKLGYPFELAIRSMRPLCDEVVILVDPSSEDDTLDRVRALSPDVLVESVWDLKNHDGLNDEIAQQTAVALARASGDWILSLQADEVLHEGQVDRMRHETAQAEAEGKSALEMTRWYFFGSLTQYRDNWTVPLPRLFRRGHWLPDPQSGAMYFVPAHPGARKGPSQAGIFHYSRIGDPLSIARRVRNLDLFYHACNRVAAEADIPPYAFSLRKLDTYVLGHAAEPDPDAHLVDFPLKNHPAAALRHFGVCP